MTEVTDPLNTPFAFPYRVDALPALGPLVDMIRTLSLGNTRNNADGIPLVVKVIHFLPVGIGAVGRAARVGAIA